MQGSPYPIKREKSAFKYVHKNTYKNGQIRYESRFKIISTGRHWGAIFNTEKEAAIAVDIKLIEIGKNPVNVLIRK
jgi:hypothetical protein